KGVVFLQQEDDVVDALHTPAAARRITDNSLTAAKQQEHQGRGQTANQRNLLALLHALDSEQRPSIANCGFGCLDGRFSDACWARLALVRDSFENCARFCCAFDCCSIVANAGHQPLRYFRAVCCSQVIAWLSRTAFPWSLAWAV